MGRSFLAVLGLASAVPVGASAQEAADQWRLEAVVGGVSLFGGKGTILGAAIGATLVATISNLMNVMNVDSYWQPLVIGLIILAGVTFDTMRSSNRLKFPWAKGKKSAKS